jgi:hypothetical protein
MPTWLLLLLLGWAVLITLMLLSAAGKRAELRESVTGEVISVRFEQHTLTTGMRTDCVVVVRTDAGPEVVLRDPPYPVVAVGNRIEHGKLVQPLTQDDEPPPEARINDQ